MPLPSITVGAPTEPTGSLSRRSVGGSGGIFSRRYRVSHSKAGPLCGALTPTPDSLLGSTGLLVSVAAFSNHEVYVQPGRTSTGGNPYRGEELDLGGSLGLSADLIIAGAAVDRPVAARNEWHLRHHTAFRARRGVHLPRCPAAEAGKRPVAYVTVLSLVAPGVLPSAAARRTPHRLVLQPLAGVELLLSSSKNKTAVAIAANKCLIGETH
jgi:hypothetical protein